MQSLLRGIGVVLNSFSNLFTLPTWEHKTSIDLTIPMLMSLFSLICLFAIEMLKKQSLSISSSAWYNKKDEATFDDILAFVRRDI